MVRLKEHLSALVLTSLRVSIPYGTIKSCTLCRKRKVSQVSIPYGTIKRLAGNIFSNVSATVSIPYGTIKRIGIPRAVNSAIVSIPYGTIKRLLAPDMTKFMRCFNSLWYD